MAEICPTITAYNPHQYREQMERVSEFADRIHIDLMDGLFAPTRSLGYKHTWWAKEKSIGVDIHLMYENPLEVVEYLSSMRPQLIIVHAEANHLEVEQSLKFLGREKIKRGLAILPETVPHEVNNWLKMADYCLVFSGDLGHFGGRVDFSQADKIPLIKDINPNLEIGWDGGINADNAADLIVAGVDVLNVGGFIQRAERPDEAYAILQQISKTPK